MEFWGYVTGLGWGILCLVSALVLYKFGVPKKYTRKVVHILVGFEWIFLYNFLGAGVHFLIICILFLSILLISYRFKLMPMISSEEENSPGTVYYGVAMTGVALVGCFKPEVMIPFGIAIFCTSIGDGFAGLFGQIFSYSPKIYKNKTYVGAAVNFVASFVSVLVMSSIFSLGLNVFECLAIALFSASVELISEKGLDNITVTWGVTALAYALIYYPAVLNYIVPIVFTPLVIVFAVSSGALTGPGVVAAIGIDAVVSCTLGNFGFIILLSFLGGGVIFDKIKKCAKNKDYADIVAKGDRRDHMQVFANSIVATLCGVLYYFSMDRVYLVAFLGAMSCAFADTVASCMGVFARSTYDVFKLRRCEAGISGGMSLIGTVSSVFAALVFALLGYAFGAVGITDAVVVLLSGFVGALFDSLLGSLFQAKYKCNVCGKITEKLEHCNSKTSLVSGLRLIDNDVVNLLSTLIAAGFAITLSSIL